MKAHRHSAVWIATFLLGSGLNSQSFPSGVTVTATTITPIVLSARVGSLLPGTDTLPPGASTPTLFELSANSSGFVPADRAEIQRQVAIDDFGDRIRLTSIELAGCLVFGNQMANAFSTPHDVLFTITPSTVLDCDLAIAHLSRATPNTAHSVEVDINNNGVIDFRSTSTAPNSSASIPLPRNLATPLFIRVRSSSSANATPRIFETVQCKLELLLTSRTSSADTSGCVQDLFMVLTGRLDGGANFATFDATAGRSPIGANVLLFGTGLPAPVALPLAAAGSLGACTLDITPSLSIDLPRTPFWSILEIPNGLPLSLRPITVQTQLIGLAGNSTAPTLHSTSPVAVTFR